MRDLYREVEGGADIAASQAKLRQIENEFYSVTISKQIFLSDWYAHYKFFAQTQTDWMNAELDFHVWKDMIPLSAKVVLILSALAIIGYVAYSFTAGHFIWCSGK